MEKILKPNYFYKYSSLDNDYIFEQILNPYLWFSNANELNDPFDMK